MGKGIFKFFSSLKLAVISILLLAGVLAVATILESRHGMRAAHVAVYGTWWFTGVLALLGANVICAALSRYPWKKHQTGFVITHLGIIVILVGAFQTQQWGIDGNLPVREGFEGSEVILSDLKLSITEPGGQTPFEVPVPESAVSRSGDLVTVNFENGARLIVDKFYPRAAVETQVVKSSVPQMGVPAIKIQVGNSRFRTEEWILASAPGKAAELNLGPAIIKFRKLAPQEKPHEKAQSIAKNQLKIGYLIGNLQGREFRVEIDSSLKKWVKLGSSDLEVFIDRYLPYAIVDNNQLTSKNNEPVNPAVQLKVRRGLDVEQHTVFANFPEFSTMHRKQADAQQFGLKFRMISTAGKNADELAGVGNRRGELEFSQSAAGDKLYFRSLGKNGDEKAKGEVTLNQSTPTGWMDLEFKVVEWLPYAVQEELPRPIDLISGSDAFLSAVRVRVENSRDSASTSGTWLVEGVGRLFDLNGKQITVRFQKEKMTLPFKIFLDHFEVGTNPGTQKAASYSSNVTVKDGPNGNTQKATISMNEPMKYGGYTFYQASYQTEEGQAPVSVFAVNHDPGRILKYLGSLIMVLGILLMFVMNPHYWNKIFGMGKGNA